MMLQYNFVLVFYIFTAITHSLLIHGFNLIIVYLIVVFIHSCLLHVKHTYHNTLLTFNADDIPINCCTSGECFWSHFQMQHPPIFENFTIQDWTSHDDYQTRDLVNSWWTNQLHCYHHLSRSPEKSPAISSYTVTVGVSRHS